ncbi:protein kinase [Stigmatella sp. ncwal1]|uniref:non-specific serine/threonine protein kinase n=1 Tax=Stigmatella ashevillensis TaxID=2995309 RepID=A0ABT5DL46_9BACT|nr:protein kinase [Stigmatella ashevillena]MDC0714389.1 protein kinase [Stigmatella ashevillena]
MTMDAFHPDHLKPGQMVGPWRIVESLGSGNFGHAFKAEREGDLFTLKMAVRPAPDLPQETPERTLEERQVDGRMCHEAAVLMANTSHPGLPHLRAMDRWPHPIRGYLYIVTDYVPGGPFHEWREQTRPTAAQLVDIFIDVVRAVALLHRRGILIRDFKSEHVIVNPNDHKPVIVDMGSAWLPGGSTLTVGLAPGTPHALPPECIAFIREGAWKEGARFGANAAGDLYQLGVFIYEALTDHWPFDPRMSQDELLAAIETVIPRAPHRINPEVPEALSRIALKLLEKRPEDRYQSAEGLLQALWDAAKERSKPAWKVSLELPAGGPAPVSQEEVEERRLQKQEAERKAKEVREQGTQELSHEEALAQLSVLTQEIQNQWRLVQEKAARSKTRWRRIALVVGPLLLVLGLFAARQVWLTPVPAFPTASEKGSSSVSTFSNSRPIRIVSVWLCAAFSIGCPAAQVRPMPGDCPLETAERMREMGFLERGGNEVIIDIHQPGTRTQAGIYREGKVVGRVVTTSYKGALPDGTLLYGQLWTENIFKRGEEAVLGRYTEALLPDGRRIPVCFSLGDDTGLTTKMDGSKPGQARLQRSWVVRAVEIWP